MHLEDLKTICDNGGEPHANTCVVTPTGLAVKSKARRMRVRDKGQRDRREVKDRWIRGRVRDERKKFTSLVLCTNISAPN